MDILAATETYLKQDTKGDQLEIEGYKVARNQYIVAWSSLSKAQIF